MQKLYLLLVFSFFFSFSNAQDAPFITTWEVEANDLEITIPTTGSGYDYTIDFGDGTVENNVSGNISHTYDSPGTYTVSITGDFPKINFFPENSDRSKIRSVEQWGNIQWENMSYAFTECDNLVFNASDVPDLSQVTDMKYMFKGCDNFNSNINNWDVSNVTDMSHMFERASLFNQSLDSWDVSNVTDMSNLFHNAEFFNRPLNNWNVSNVENMNFMFFGAYSFDQPLDEWDVSSVVLMKRMFSGLGPAFSFPLNSFNQDLSSWNFNDGVYLNNFLSNSQMDIENYDLLLNHFLSLNLMNKTFNASGLVYCSEDIRDELINNLGWTISGDSHLVNCDTSLLPGAFVTRWRVSDNDLEIGIPTSGNGYNYTIDFGDGNVENNVSGDIWHTYTEAGTYNVSISGDFPKIVMGYQNSDFQYSNNEKRLISIEQWGDIQWQSMNKAFTGCRNLVINAIDMPDLSQVTDTIWMFSGCDIINTNINDWDVSNVTDMSGMFRDATLFNQPLNNWDVSNVTNIKSMFSDAKSFNQPLNNWDVSNITNMSYTFSGAKSFNQSLNDWDVSNVTDMRYMFSETNSFNQSLNNWDVSNMTDMSSMFRGADLFNQPLNNWDVSNMTDMSSIFRGADLFNQPLNNWDVSNVTDMRYMFSETNSFNQPLNDWDISNVLSMQGMFHDAENFNQDISSWDFNPEISFLFNEGGFIDNSGLSVFYYDALLAKFEELGLESRYFIADNLEYCNAGVRNELIDNLGWTISGDSLSEDCAFNYVSGNLHYDDNNDGCDNNDIPAESFLINANDGTYDFGTLSLADGTYNLNLLEGNYTITLNNLPQYYTVNPETTTFNFTGAGEQEQLDFCLTANQTVEDLNITLLPTSEARPGFEADYQLVVENMGTQSLATANISLIFDDTKQSFVSATPAETSSTNNQLNFEINNLPPFGQQVIDFTMQTFQPPTVNGDDILNFTATISPNANDYTPEDNTFIYEQTVVNSFDPNDKQVLQGEQVHIDKADQYLDYLIRFQNTGTASAINVRILDTLHPDLDYSTIKPISASADYRVEITNGNEVEFIFDDIYLPHADENEPGSHGFVAYKIKPKTGVAIGDVITGDASIFFDFNAPIITNTVSTEFVDDLNTDNYSLENLVRIYPNPVTDLLNIKTEENIHIKNLKIYNLQGQELLQFPQSTKRINLSQLSAGMYILKVQTNQGSINQQILKQ